MLTDIFARRYESKPLLECFGQREARFLVQAFRILEEDIYPYYRDGKGAPANVAFWTELHRRLSRELGLHELSPLRSSYRTQRNGNDHVQVFKNSMVEVCKKWMMGAITGSPDAHMKERLSLVELGFRIRENEIDAMNASAIKHDGRILAVLSRARVPAVGDPNDAARMRREAQADAFRANVDELNTRFRQAGLPLNYHNGFIQVRTDDLVQCEVETPFWQLVSAPSWTNVDIDMKEALDRRDSEGRDPALYAARALESAIKIISDNKGWTSGGEKGAHNYIDNLASKSNRFITSWECASLKEFFTHVRNPFGHGAGSSQMPTLSRPQTEWAIEFSMIWIKNLIRRL